MLSFTTPFATHLAGRNTALTYCWAITKRNGNIVRGTMHNRDVTITTGPYAGVYKQRSAVIASEVASPSTIESVPNVDLTGVFRVDAVLGDLTVAELEGGLYDQAPAVLLLVNWKSPNDDQKVVRAGTLGEFARDTTQKYRSEVRGIAQAYRQQITRTYSERCDVERLGNARCQFVIAAATRTATVSTVTDRRNFVVALDAGPAPVGDPNKYYVGGLLLFTSGDNDGAEREVKVAAVSGSNVTIELWDETAADVVIGDDLELPPGCDRLPPTCKAVHNNFVNYQGYGLYAVGRDRLARGPK